MIIKRASAIMISTMTSRPSDIAPFLSIVRYMNFCRRRNISFTRMATVLFESILGFFHYGFVPIVVFKLVRN
jgi:hypothetical protein